MKRFKSKKGYTLIETVAVLVMVLPLISLVALMLRRSLVQYSSTIDQAFKIQATDQWTQRLRDDIHEATEAVVGSDGNSLTLTLPNQESIRYFQDGLTTSRQQNVQKRSLATERSPWSAPLRFEKKESSRIPLIEADTGVGPRISTRLGINAISPEAIQ